jgi:hypothetical protein
MSSRVSIESSRITLPDSGYKTCDDVYVKLLIYPSAHKTAEVSEVLAIKPTSAQEKGDEITNSRGKTRIAKNTLWVLSSEGSVTSRDLRDHLNWLICKLQGKEAGLKSLQSWDELKMTVSCVWWSAFGHGGPVLWPEQMKALAELNLECSFDIYFSDPD